MTAKPPLTEPYYFEKDDHVRLLDHATALKTLKLDLLDHSDCYVWTFLLDDDFFRECFLPHLEHSNLFAIIDARQITRGRALLAQHKRLQTSRLEFEPHNARQNYSLPLARRHVSDHRKPHTRKLVTFLQPMRARR